MYRQLSSDMQEEYAITLLTVFENLEALYICRNVIIVLSRHKIMIDVARQKPMNDPMFKHLSETIKNTTLTLESLRLLTCRTQEILVTGLQYL